MKLLGVRSAVVAWFIVAAGCGGPTQEQSQPAENLRQIAVMCGRHMAANKGKMPASSDDLKKFAADAGVKDFDKFLNSPRDNEPYVLVLTAKAGVPGVGAKEILAHEKTGVGGKRYVAYTTNEIAELDEESFKSALAKKN